MKCVLCLVGVFAVLASDCIGSEEVQPFTSAQSAAAAGWAAQNANVNGNDYGFRSSNLANGASVGEIGGTFVRCGVPSYYADLTIGGPYSRSSVLSATGRFNVTTISRSPPYNGSLYVGHFNRVEDQINQFKGHVGFNLAENTSSNLRFQACVVFADGRSAADPTPLVISGLPNSPRNWSYTWNPTGGAFGFGQLIVTVDGPGGGITSVDVDSTFAGADFSIDSFGVSSPQVVNPDGQKLIIAYFDDFTFSQAFAEAGPNSVPAMPMWGYPLLFVLMFLVAGRSKILRSAT